MRTIRMLTVSLAMLALVAGSSLGTAAQSTGSSTAPAAADLFSGRINFGNEISHTTGATDGCPTECWDFAFAPVIVEMSDPRLAGTATLSFNSVDYAAADGTSTSVSTATWRIENANGAWQGSYYKLQGDGISGMATAPLVGEGAYEGLTAVWEQALDDSGWVIKGVIIPGGPPAAPSAP